LSGKLSAKFIYENIHEYAVTVKLQEIDNRFCLAMTAGHFSGEDPEASRVALQGIITVGKAARDTLEYL
jgi:hypothetical protein